MNTEQQQIIDEVYKNYCKSFEPTDSPYDFRIKGLFGNPLTKDEFINKCKTNPEFSEKWGLKIEERELSLEERALWLQNNKDYDLLVGNLDHDHIREVVENETPTKLITITYNNKTIESYD